MLHANGVPPGDVSASTPNCSLTLNRYTYWVAAESRDGPSMNKPPMCERVRYRATRANFCSAWQFAGTSPRLPPADMTTSPT